MLKIDPDFQSLIPPLSPEELLQLEQNILSQKRCRDAIVVWKGIIIDGHNRYALCQKHNIPFETTNMRFPSRKEAQLWILENQLGRRNLTDAMRIELAYNKTLLHKPRGGIRRAIAKDAGVSEQTVHKYMTIKKLGDSKLIAQVNSGDVKISAAHGMLEVTTKTVSSLASVGDVNAFVDYEPYRLRAMLASIGRIGRIYEFLMAWDFEIGGDAAAGVCRHCRAALTGIIIFC